MSRQRERTRRVVRLGRVMLSGRGFLLVGGVLLVAAVVETLRVVALRHRGVLTQGTVVRHLDDSDSVTAIVEFQTRSGETFQFRNDLMIAGEDWSIGARWPVLYPPDHPERARAQGARRTWLSALVLFGLALVAFGVGGVLWASGP